MAYGTTRRTFIKQVGTTGATLPAAIPPLVRAASPNEKLNMAAIGCGGKGWSDLNKTSKGQNVVALCDVDESKRGLGRAKKKFEKAKVYNDFRRMLDREGDKIDACNVSTPDHMHAPATMMAMVRGIHTYTQKPLTHDVYEARQLRLGVEKHKTVTQMGNQHHSGAGYRTLVATIQSGAIGKVKEAHAWSNRPIWPQGMGRPEGKDPVPDHLHWDLWLGTAPERPFKKGTYHPFKWRGFIDFGTGAQGDMACHIMDPVVWSLDLGDPTDVMADAPPPNGETYPKWSEVRYTFPGTKHTKEDTIQVTWHDGGKKPSRDLVPYGEGRKLPNNGTLYIGTKGVIVCAHGGGPELLPTKEFKDYKPPKKEHQNHYQEWTQACLGKGKTSSDFTYAGPLTEVVLLGNIAIRYPGVALEWDADALEFTNASDPNQFIKRNYRSGWEVDGLT